MYVYICTNVSMYNRVNLVLSVGVYALKDTLSKTHCNI